MEGDKNREHDQGIKLCVDTRVVGNFLGWKHAVGGVRWCVKSAKGPCFGVLEYRTMGKRDRTAKIYRA